jgi:rhodanese-related sulfurtransferase
MTKEEFMAEVLSGLMPPPGYFPQNVLLNIKGYESFDKVMRKGKQALSPISFEAAANETEAVIIDTRDPQVFAQGFIPNSINVGIDGSFATWVGTLVPDVTIPLLLVCDTGREDEAITRIAERLRRTAPQRSFFYASGRSSNEAAFILQLFARLYGSNHVNNCSYYCHQASGVGLQAAIGTGTATVQYQDLAHADTIFIGPGEDTWPKFLEDFRNGKPVKEYRSTVRSLIGMPAPRRDLLKRELYLVPNSIVVSRGCPHNCDFCYKKECL